MTYDTTTEVPRWLNPIVLPEMELRLRIRAAADALQTIASDVDRWIVEYGSIFAEYETNDPSKGWPDEVRNAIDELTGYEKLLFLIDTAAAPLVDLAHSPADRDQVVATATARMVQS